MLVGGLGMVDGARLRPARAGGLGGVVSGRGSLSDHEKGEG